MVPCRRTEKEGNRTSSLGVKTNNMKVKSQRTLIKEAKERGRQQGMVQGLCIAIADILEVGYTTRATEIWSAAGLSIKECQKMKVDEYDMKTLIAHKEELEG